jgi:serine phosphatase RsbU (regulator of sigma subunit)
MGKSFLQLKDEKSAEEFFSRSLHLALHLRAKKLIRYNYYDLALLNYSHGNNKEAFEQMYRYNLYKDSVLQDQGLLESAQIENRIRDQKKQQEIVNLNTSNALKEAELKNNRIVIWSISGGLSLVAVLALFILYNLVQKRKINLLLEEKNAEITEKNQDILDSIRYASGIQESILPGRELMESALGKYFVVYLPKDIVSGDFYWVNRIDDRIFFAAADCTGHGVPGAFMSLLGVQTLNQAIIENHIESPARILDFANAKTKELLAHRGLYNTTRDGMDIALCSLDRKKMMLNYSGANNPLWIVRNGELMEIKANKQSIGAASAPFTDHVVELLKNDIIYIFTDGFQDQFGGKEYRKIKSKGFRELLLSINSKPFHEHAELIRSYLVNWKGEEEQTDDILVIGVCLE